MEKVPSALTLAQHRSHDYRFLIRCWRELVEEAGLRMRILTRVGGMPVYGLESKSPDDGRPEIYISAGVHGDEVAGPWGLLEWARENGALLRERRFLLFPAMNPVGMILNTRMDHQGRDLNRSFHELEDELMVAWRKLMEGRKLAIGLCLHEDYDGQGCYLYELNKTRKTIGKAVLQDCAEVIAVDGRRSMDGSRSNEGLIAKRKIPVLPGLPEAIVLHELGAPVALTFETPSEFSLVDRVRAQKTFITSALKHACVL
ncbi:M14 family metallopeptidase [Phragmitibacter flavus]|nr:M14 family metallocarboxypeptidase [Phragmitibacter flavus]